MRQWRIGTVTMGLALVIMGVLLFISGANGKEFTNLFLAWWPLIFILLGIEVLLYPILFKKENSIVKYDVFSIFFIGILGTICIGLALLTSVGLLDEVQSTLSSVERTYDLPSVKHDVSNEIQRIVVQQGYNKQIDFNRTSDNEVQFFGTFRATTDESDQYSKLEESDIVTSHVSGNTMYISIKDLPEERGFNSYYSQMVATLIIPEGIELIVKPESVSNEEY